MLFIQPLITSVISHRLPRSYHGPNRPSDPGIGSKSFYTVNVTCVCNASLLIRNARNFNSHTKSKVHKQKMKLLGYDLIGLRDKTNVDHVASFFRNGFCITCCRFTHEKYNLRRNMEFHLHSTSHLLSLYLQSIALNRNGSDPYNIEVQCPFFCYYRYSLRKPHLHRLQVDHSGQYTTIYCNILRLIRPELMPESRTSSLKDLLQVMIPTRILGDCLFSIDDVCDTNGRQLPLDVMHSSFKSG